MCVGGPEAERRLAQGRPPGTRGAGLASERRAAESGPAGDESARLFLANKQRETRSVVSRGNRMSESERIPRGPLSTAANRRFVGSERETRCSPRVFRVAKDSTWKRRLDSRKRYDHHHRKHQQRGKPDSTEHPRGRSTREMQGLPSSSFVVVDVGFRCDAWRSYCYSLRKCPSLYNSFCIMYTFINNVTNYAIKEMNELFCRLYYANCRLLVESPPVLTNGGVENGARGGRGPRSAQRTCRE
jgi:hypothetical protein